MRRAESSSLDRTPTAATAGPRKAGHRQNESLGSCAPIDVETTDNNSVGAKYCSTDDVAGGGHAEVPRVNKWLSVTEELLSFPRVGTPRHIERKLKHQYTTEGEKQ